jgi:hypothetical protein
MDAAGDTMSVGSPMINHVKEDTYLRNIWQENLAHTVNDDFLRVLAEAREELTVGSYLDMMEQICAYFMRRKETCSPILRAYFTHLGPCLSAWNSALRPWERRADRGEAPDKMPPSEKFGRKEVSGPLDRSSE